MAGNKPKVVKKQKSHSPAWGVAVFFAVIWLIITVTPFIFMVLNSFRKQFDMLQQGVFHLPDPWTFKNYVEVVTGTPVTVSNGTLTSDPIGQGNMRCYVLQTAGAPSGKIGPDGTYLK